ncbi:DegQ family serine endoprotease [Aliidiomarina halalkaliphila]|uniref:DegQ family serine endoprotease n=1 Tax=Aliidiomarina halalkaliphila TaxID=2593535 RepID=A0A552X5X8_9GAMM|nr:DegQ family serine endoprotease [Aliidiomarina halalkaliphila]TRW50431.1 DegQ family serine endoprotease [Aliidiomarina halalkaliphila]
MKKMVTLLAAASLAFVFSLQPVVANIPAAAMTDERGVPTLAPMLEEVTPAVVNISVAGKRVTRQRLPEAFRFFFGPNAPQEQVREQPFRGLGSGVIIDAKNGYVVTNNHVIDDANEITVTLKDGRQFSATVLGRDEESDIALLQLENPRNLTQINIGNSDQLRVGDFVVAIGNPFGLGQTVTSGIVSALGRSGLGIDRLENFIQTDAAINSGNSGGALVDLNGNLIGINTAIIGASGGNIGIGFAIPANMMKNLVDQIIEFGEIRRGVLGVRGGNLTQELADALDIDRVRGAWVSEVLPESAAERAGIQAGDLILAIDGTPVHSFTELAAKVGTIGAGREVQLRVLREGREMNVTVELDERGTQQVNADSIHPALEGAELTREERGGIRIESVESGSPAARLGLREGDVIIAVNRQRVDSVQDLQRFVQNARGVVALNLRRGNSSLYVVLPN